MLREWIKLTFSQCCCEILTCSVTLDLGKVWCSCWSDYCTNQEAGWQLSFTFALISLSLYFSSRILHSEELGENIMSYNCLDENGQSNLGAFRTTLASCLGSQLYNQVTLQSKWCSLQKSIVSCIIWPGRSFCLMNYDVSAMWCSKMLFQKAGTVCRPCHGYFNGNWNG